MHKKQINRLLATVLSIVMILSLVVIPAAAAGATVGATWDFSTLKKGDGADYAQNDPLDSTLDGYDNLTLNNVMYHSTSYGTTMGSNGSIDIAVGGNCDIQVEVGYEWKLQLGEDATTLETNPNNGNATVTFHYNGGEGTATLKSMGTTYIKTITLADYTTPPAKLTLDKASVTLKMGETTSATVTATLTNSTDTITATSGDENVATVAQSGDNNETITITAVAAGTTTVTVAAGDLEKEVAVTVQAAGKSVVDANEADAVFLFGYNGHDGKKGGSLESELIQPEKATGVDFGSNYTYHDTQHGLNGSGALTVSIPDGKYANIKLTTCSYGKGDPCKVKIGDAEETEVPGKDATGDDGDGGKFYVIKNATGDTVITLGSAYIHGITVSKFTDAPAVDPSLDLDVTEVVVKAGGTAIITPTIENVDSPEVSVLSADGTIATTEVSMTNVITVTGGAAGKTTLNVTVKNTDLAETVTVYVQPDQVGELVAGTYNFEVKGENDGKLALYTTATGMEWTDIAMGQNPDHGPYGKNGGSLKVYVPDGKLADLEVSTCAWGGGAPITTADGNGTVGTTVDGDPDPVVTPIVGVSGEGVINFGGQVYVHGIKVTLRDATADAMSVSAESVTMREKESKEVTASVTGYAGKNVFAVSEDETKATVAVEGTKITITGVAEGETNVYVVMAETQPTLAEAQADDAAKTIAVTVTPGLVEGTKEWVWGGKDGSHSKDTFDADSEGLKLPSKEAVNYHNDYGILAKPKMAEDGKTIAEAATIGIPVDGPSTITVKVGYTWDIMLGDAQNPSRYGTSNNVDAVGNTSGYEYPVVFDYYGGAGFVTLTATEKAASLSSYIYSIMVEPKAGATANPKVAVWDLAGTQLDPTMFDNKITVEDIIAFYQPSEQWPDSKVPTLGSFATADGEFAFVAEPKGDDVRNDYRLRSGLEALKDWVHSTNNYTKSDIAAGEDPYEPTLTSYNVSFQSNGGVMTFKIKAEAGDKLTFAYANSGTADGEVFMDFIDAADAGTEGKVTKTLENKKGVGNGNVASVYVAQTGIQTITHGPMPSDATQAQKPAVARFYRESPSKVTIAGSLTEGSGVTAGYKLIATDDVSGVEYEATIADGQYSIEVNNYLSGTSFTLSVTDAEGCIVGVGEKVEVPAGAKSVSNDVAIVKVDLVTVSGTVTGLTEADLANLVLTVGIPEDKIYTPKIIPAADGTYTAKLEKDTAYTLTAANVNDYELGVTALNKSADETDVAITFTKKPVYAVTITADPSDVDMSAMKFTFTNFAETDDKHPDGYVYTFTGTTGIELRDGQYKVKLDGAPYPTKIVTDLKVNGAAASKTITFVKETPTSWVFTQNAFTADVLAAKDFNMLKLDGDVRREAKDHAILGNGGKMSVPVDGPCRVDVTVYYFSDLTIGVGEDTIPAVLVEGDPAYKTTGATQTFSYNYAGPDAGYVDVTAASTTYITKIEVVEVIPYKETLTVGVDKDFQTIQAAVDAAAKMDRPNNERVTIVIDPGNYEEMIWVQTPNITFKNAAANPSIALKNQGKDIDDTGVRITWYYGCGFDYYSMGPNSKFSAEQLAVNKENGYVSHPNSAGGGSNNECWWNATTVIAATGFQAEGIIFENSFNQYVSAAAANDVIVPNGGAKQDNSKPRAGLSEGSTEVQRKAYVERAAAIALANDKASDAVFDNCAFVGHQDVIYGGHGVKAAFYDCDVFGACDYIFGPMTAVFAKCDMVLNVGADSDANDVAYITAPQNGSNVHGYLMYNCNVRSVEPGVENAGTTKTAVQHEFGRAWGGATAECVFFETTVGTNANGKSLISPAGWNTGLGSSQICTEYHTHEEAADADHTSRIMGGILETPQTKAGAELGDYVAWLGGWDPFEGKKMGVTCPDATDAVTSVTLKDGEDAAEATYELEVGAPLELTVDVAPATAYQYFLVSGATDAITVTKGDGKITVEATDSVDEPVVITVTAVGANADGNMETTTVSFTAISPVPATKVTVTGPEAATSSEAVAGVETTIQLTAAVEPAETTQRVTWTSSSEKVTVDATGKITVPADATAETVTITATAAAKAEDGSEVKTTYTVVIKDADDALADVIKAAEAEAKATEVSEDGADVSKGSMWVAQAVKDTFQDAIDAAKAVAEDENATTAEKAAAVDDLNAAIKAFKEAQKEGSKSNGRPAIGQGTTPDGEKSTTTTTTNPDGSVVTTVKDKDGNLDITVKTEDGEELAHIKLPATVSGATKFIDVPDDHWAAKCINDMAALGMVKGVNEDGTIFDMNSPITRGSIATILYRMSNGAEGKTSSFADVAPDAWYADAIGWAANAKLINGYDETTFGPDDSITRQQLAVMIARMARLMGIDTSAHASALEAFTDGADTAQWATDGMAWCVKAGIVKGRGGDVLDPTAAVTRAEAVTMLDRMIGLVK